MTFTIHVTQLWENGQVGGEESEQSFHNNEAVSVGPWLMNLASSWIGMTGEDGVKCDALDITLSKGD